MSARLDAAESGTQPLTRTERHALAHQLERGWWDADGRARIRAAIAPATDPPRLHPAAAARLARLRTDDH